MADRLLSLRKPGGLVLSIKGSDIAKVKIVSIWPETIEDGWNTLVSSDKDKIIAAVKHFEPGGKQRDVFGDGKAAGRIVEILASSRYN